MKKLLNNQRSALVGNQKGVALMMALFSIIFISFLATELGFEARTDYQFSNAIYHETKAYYAAKSAVELSLFRIHLFRKAKEVAGSKLPDPSMLDMIWSFPFIWPPVLGEDASLASKDDLNNVLKESLQDANWTSSIQPESSKIDINDLDSPSEALAKSTAQQIIQLIKNRLEQDDDWADQNSNISAEDIVKHMADYIDKNDESGVGGAESSYYQDIEGGNSLPPNRPFRNIDELRLIPGIDDVLYDYLAPQFSIYGSKALNVNFASKDVLMSIDPQITDEVAKEIRTRIESEDGPFKNQKDFEDFLSTYITITSFNPNKIPLIFEEESAFTVLASGSYGSSTKNIKVIVFDYAKIQDRLGKSLAEQNKANNPPADAASEDGEDPNKKEQGNEEAKANNNSNQVDTSLTKKPPSIVSWEED